MKKSLLLTALLFTVFSISYAQDGKQRKASKERVKQPREWMKTELQLTAEQIAQVDSINLVYVEAQKKLREGIKGERKKNRESMIALKKEREDAFSIVFTKEQMDLYKKKGEYPKKKDSKKGKKMRQKR